MRMLGCKSLGELQIATLKRIMHDSTYMNSLHSLVSENVVFFSSAINKSASDKWIDICDYEDSYLKTSYLQSPKVVFENINDAMIYKKVCEWYLYQVLELNSYKVSFEPINGGGDTTANVCESLLKEGIAFSVCDSDKKSPSCEVGETARKTKEVFSKYGRSSNFILIEAHEVENLIPLDLYKECAREQQMPIINFLEKAVGLQPCCYGYFDMKKSFKYKEIWGGNKTYSDYWRCIFERVELEGFEIGESRINQSDEGVKVNGTILNNLSVVSKFAAQKLSSMRVEELKLNGVERTWNEIGVKLFDWFVSHDKIRL